MSHVEYFPNVRQDVFYEGVVAGGLNSLTEAVRVTQLGYIGVGVSDMAAWRDFASSVLGMQESGESADGALFIRTDAYHHRFILTPTGEDDITFAGWEVKDAEALSRIADQVRAYGIEVTEGSPELCAQRLVLGLVTFTDPEGLAVEIYHGGYRDHRPFVSQRGVRGFKADALGLGHIVLSALDPVEYLRFYTEVMGARLSDYILMPMGDRQAKVAFLHVNPRHHSIAIAPGRPPREGAPKPKRINHFMVEVEDINDVGFAHGIFQARGIPNGMLGRHTNDQMISFYGTTPSGFNVEYGHGGLLIEDEESWEVQHHRAPSLWGHGVVRQNSGAH